MQAAAPVNFLDRATPVIERGFSVLPLAPRDKAPVPGLGATSATNNANIVEHWSELYPDANVGIASDANFTLLETDDETRFRSLVRMATSRELPETLQLGSGRPNRCCWVFKRSAVCGNDCLELPSVFEFRNRHQYVAAPGSIHPQGQVYHWQNDAPVADFPEWLMPALTQMARAYKGEATHEHIKTGPAKLLFNAYSIDLDPESMFGMDIQISDGERHYALQSVAGFLHDGERCADDIYDILIRLRDEYCTAGKGDYELRRIADDIVNRKPCELEPQLRAMMVDGIVYRDAAEFDAAIKAFADSWRSMFLTREEIDAAKPLEFYIDGFLQQSTVTLIGAGPGSFKTWVGLSMSKALLTADVWLKFPVVNRPSRVLYLVPEMSTVSIKHRVAKMRMLHLVGAGLFITTIDKGGEITLDDARLAIAAKDAVVVLDTAVRFMEGDENASKDLKVLSANCFRLLKAGAGAVLGFHHSPKAFAGASDITLENILRGSGEMAAMAGTVWGQAKVDEDQAIVYLQCVKSRDFDEHPKPFVIQGRPHINEAGDFKLLHAVAPDGFFRSARQAGRGAKTAGVPRPNRQLPDDTKELILALSRGGKSQRAIADELHLSPSTVNAVVRERSASVRERSEA